MEWLPRLHQRYAGHDGLSPEQLGEWAKTVIPGYDPEIPGKSYAWVMQNYFRTDDDRQSEFEKRIQGVDPKFGYAILAELLTTDPGARTNVVLTVNFDDLVADALYLYTQKKPRVLAHDALMGYGLGSASHRPLIIKLHGDAMLPNQKHTEEQTACLPEGAVSVLESISRTRGLIFAGYSGNDRSIIGALNKISDGFPHGVYWVGQNLPDSELAQWLSDSKAVWVRHRDFDQLMLLLRGAFELPDPNFSRLGGIQSSYKQAKNEVEQALSDTIGLSSRTEVTVNSTQTALAVAASQEAGELTDWQYRLKAYSLESIGKDAAEKIFLEGLSKYPESASLLSSYALFLEKYLELNQAEEYYLRAIAVDPVNPKTLCDYADLLEKMDRMDEAGHFHERATAAGPKEAYCLGRYAHYLDRQNRLDEAEKYYARAIAAGPSHALNLTFYAEFKDRQGRLDEAEQLHKRAVESDHDNVFHRTRYGLFLEKHNRIVEAEECFRSAVDSAPHDGYPLFHLANVLVRLGRTTEAEQYYNRAVEADPASAFLHYSFAQYLEDCGRTEGAEQRYRNAAEAAPDDPFFGDAYTEFLKRSTSKKKKTKHTAARQK